jgi:hypothetical protein
VHVAVRFVAPLTGPGRFCGGPRLGELSGGNRMALKGPPAGANAPRVGTPEVERSFGRSFLLTTLPPSGGFVPGPSSGAVLRGVRGDGGTGTLG